MNEQIINKLQEIFTPVAEKIGEGAAFGWEVVLRQQIVYGQIGLLFAIIGVFILIATFKTSKHCLRKLKEDGREDWGFAAATIGAFGSMIGLASLLAGGINAITHLSNPAYYAIQFFMNLAK